MSLIGNFFCTESQCVVLWIGLLLVFWVLFKLEVDNCLICILLGVELARKNGRAMFNIEAWIEKRRECLGKGLLEIILETMMELV